MEASEIVLVAAIGPDVATADALTAGDGGRPADRLFMVVHPQIRTTSVQTRYLDASLPSARRAGQQPSPPGRPSTIYLAKRRGPPICVEICPIT